MTDKSDALEAAEALSRFAALPNDEEFAVLEPRRPTGMAAVRLHALLRKLPLKPDVPSALAGSPFRPCLLVNGLTLAAAHPHRERSQTLRAVAAGLSEFAAYLEAVANPGGSAQASDEDQKRYFAFVLAQMSECGMDLDGIFLTMKGDSADMGASLALRRIIEEGAAALATSELFTPQERGLLADVIDGKEGSWPAFQRRLVEDYRLPFIPARR